MFLTSVKDAVRALGPIPLLGQDRAATDVDNPMAKLTHHKLAIAMGADAVVPYIKSAALTAICIDGYYETGRLTFLDQADSHWTHLLKTLPPQQAHEVSLHASAAASYFYHEIVMRQRIDRGDVFTYPEVVDHLLRRGSDAMIYTTILSVAGIQNRGLVAGFRTLQALRDFQNDLRDLEHDRRSVGANLLLLAVVGRRKWQRYLADELMSNVVRLRQYLPRPMLESCEEAHAAILAQI